MSPKKLRKAAAETAQVAAERGTELVQGAMSRIQPLVEQAGEKVGPIAHDAKVKSANFAARTLDNLQPTINDALDKVTPAVEAARQKVQSDLLPKLQDLLHEAAEHPATQKVVEQVKPKKKSKTKTIVKVVAAGAILAGAVAAIKQFLSSKDDGWTAHEPSRAYVNTTDNFAAAQAEEESAHQSKSDTNQTNADSCQEATTDMEEEGSPVQTESVEQVVDDLIEIEKQQIYGEGSYIGDNPPEGFTIKGNERSMKYHLPGTAGFDRTIPDVWFNSEQAAESAGFIKAQR